MKYETGFILGLVIMVCDVVLWNIYGNTTGILRWVSLIFASCILGAFFNRRVL